MGREIVGVCDGLGCCFHGCGSGEIKHHDGRVSTGPRTPRVGPEVCGSAAPWPVNSQLFNPTLHFFPPSVGINLQPLTKL